jgi:glycosyltransferase 2 family protein
VSDDGRYLGRSSHPRAFAAVAAVGLAASWLVARQRPVPDWELRLTERINDVPELLADISYPVMQVGTLAGPLVVAGAVMVWRRDLRLAAVIVSSGVIAWFAAKGVKRLVERDRPATYLPSLVIREGDGTGLGFVSGHSAVAAAVAVTAAAALPPRWRPIAVAVAGAVGVARIIHGVHLPADVVGGWSLGILIGLGALAVADRVAPAT